MDYREALKRAAATFVAGATAAPITAPTAVLAALAGLHAMRQTCQ